MSTKISKKKNIVSAIDHEVLKQHYRFVPEEATAEKETAISSSTNWEQRMIRRYDEGLYREYALIEFGPQGQIGLRWRTRPEVLQGRGELSCGNKRCSSEDYNEASLTNLEVPFAYVENGLSRKELVKVKLCPVCCPLLKTTRSSQVKKESRSSSKKKDDENVPSATPKPSNEADRLEESKDDDTSRTSTVDRKKSRRRNRKESSKESRHKKRKRKRPGGHK